MRVPLVEDEPRLSATLSMGAADTSCCVRTSPSDSSQARHPCCSVHVLPPGMETRARRQSEAVEGED
jgi:hypothetical protein